MAPLLPARLAGAELLEGDVRRGEDGCLSLSLLPTSSRGFAGAIFCSGARQRCLALHAMFAPGWAVIPTVVSTGALLVVTLAAMQDEAKGGWTGVSSAIVL